MYLSPEREEDDDDEDEGEGSSKTTKPAAKRKRENRYKNAAPAVLSVSYHPPKSTSSYARSQGTGAQRAGEGRKP